MKNFIVFLLCMLSLTALGQDASLNESSVTYRGKTYHEGDIIHLGYGSSGDKEFSFIHYGKSVAGVNLPGIYRNANANWSKAEVEILKLYTEKGVIWAKCKPINRGSTLGSMIGNKIFINIEGAVDNKEIASVEKGDPDKKMSKKELKNAKLKEFTDKGKAAFTSAKDKMNAQASDLVAKGKNALNAGKEKFNAQKEELTTKGKNAMNAGKEKLNAQKEEMMTKGKNAMNSGKEKLNAQKEELVTKGKNAMNSGKEKLNAQKEELVTKGKNTMNAGKEKLNKQKEELVKKGKDLAPKKKKEE